MRHKGTVGRTAGRVGGGARRGAFEPTRRYKGAVEAAPPRGVRQCGRGGGHAGARLPTGVALC